jgi:hypothetical protein
MSGYTSNSLIIASHNWKEALALVLATVRAQTVSPGKVLIAIDGDMLIHPEFVRSHLRLACRGWYIQGSRMMLGETATARTFAAVAYHLHHRKRPTDADAANLELALGVVRDSVTRCEHGIDQHMEAA